MADSTPQTSHCSLKHSGTILFLREHHYAERGHHGLQQYSGGTRESNVNTDGRTKKRPFSSKTRVTQAVT